MLRLKSDVAAVTESVFSLKTRPFPYLPAWTVTLPVVLPAVPVPTSRFPELQADVVSIVQCQLSVDAQCARESGLTADRKSALFLSKLPLRRTTGVSRNDLHCRILKKGE